MKDLSSYVPESLHTQKKQQKSCRIFFEDLAVIEPERGFRILASRGKNLPTGADFFTTCGVFSSDSSLLRSHEPHQTRFLFPCQRGCVMLFADLLSATGLMLGILLEQSAEDVFCALKRMGQTNFIVPQRILPKGDFLSSRYDEDLCAQIDELFYYLERILLPTPEASLWTRCLLIANFVGCRLERVALPVTAPPLSKNDNARMTLFLFCSFLALRQKSGRVLTDGEMRKDEDIDLNYRCTVSFLEETLPLWEPEANSIPLQREALEKPLFLQASCFSSLTVIPTDRGMKLETKFPLPQKEHTLGSHGTRRILTLRFSLWQALTQESV